MSGLIDTLIKNLSSESDEIIQESLLRIAFVFERYRGIGKGKSPQQQKDSFAWTDDVINHNITQEEILILKAAIIGFIQQSPINPHIGSAIWALGKLMDSSTKEILIKAMIRLLDEYPYDLYQAMIALNNIGEKPFGNRNSMSALDIEDNCKLARAYLNRKGYL
jgi:hypothetical protein